MSPLPAALTVVAVLEALKQSPHGRREGLVASPAAGLVPGTVVVAGWGGFLAMRTVDWEVMESVWQNADDFVGRLYFILFSFCYLFGE